MAAATPAFGIAHVTVVPTNFEPETEDEERATGEVRGENGERTEDDGRDASGEAQPGTTD